MLSLVIIVTIVAALALGFYMGYNVRQEEERSECEVKRIIGTMMERMFHRDHTIISPLRDVEESK